MKKFWRYFKKSLIAMTLVVSMLSVSMFSGCFFIGGGGDDDSAGVDDVLYGIRVTYTKAVKDKNSNSIVPQADEDFIKKLQIQYLDASAEVLIALASQFGRGVKDATVVLRDITTEFGTLSIDDVRYAEPLEETSPNYDLMLKEGQVWSWAESLTHISDKDNDFAVEFCSKTNLFRMQVAMYCINMGIDCTGPSYGGQESYFSKQATKENLTQFASDNRITHSGLIDVEQEMLADFILNNVIGKDKSEEFVSLILPMVKEIFSQSVSTGKNGETIYKYPVVASVMVKDYYIKDIAVGAEENEDAGEDEEVDSTDFFTMKLGQQFYKSIVFMPKTYFKLNGVSLMFQSTEDLVLKVYARLHEENSNEYILNELVGELEIHAGKYDDLEGDETADLDISLPELLAEAQASADQYFMTEYNKDTDVSCFGGIAGTGLGDGIFDKYGRALEISQDEDAVTLANLYKVSKESKNSPAVISFEKLDSCYFELVFETDSNKPFNVGYVLFDYDDPE